MKTLYKCTYVQSKPYSLQLGQSLDPGGNCPAVQLRNLSFHVSLTNMYIPQTQKGIYIQYVSRKFKCTCTCIKQKIRMHIHIRRETNTESSFYKYYYTSRMLSIVDERERTRCENQMLILNGSLACFVSKIL